MSNKDKAISSLLEGAKITLFISAFVAFFIVTVMPAAFWDENVIPAFSDLLLTYFRIFVRSALVIGALLVAFSVAGHLVGWWQDWFRKP